MSIKLICITSAVALLATLAVPASCQTASVTVNAASTGVRIGSMHYGIFYEEINHAGDAGLWAELIKNRSFEDGTPTDGWTKLTTSGAAGTLTTDTTNQLNAYNKTELAVNVTAVSTGKCGVYNSGYYSLPITSSKSYNCVIYARKASGFAGALSVRLEDSSATASNTYTIANANLATTWTKYSFTLTATRTLSAARLAITTASLGTFYLTYVSLMPADALDGFRPDLLQKLIDLKPGFVRFPGGCYVEGNVLAEAWQWKGGIGAQEARRTHWNLWGYWNTNGLGLYEYLVLCEKLGAEPLLVTNCGMSHNGTVQGTALDPYVQDALDAIEFANGASTTTWGAQRAAMGHTAPFNLKYLEIGNENGGDIYNTNYGVFYTAIKAQYPTMNLVTNTGVSSKPMEILDEHYYTNPDWFAQQNHHYDGYSRTGPKIYVGEYAVTQGAGQGNLAAGLGEAMFMLGMERNADIVTMCSYAPLFVNVNNRQWNPDLINFNASSSYGIPSFYVQKMLSTNKGDVNLATTSSGPSNSINMLTGGVGVATWVTQSEYADVLVTNGATTLYQSNFAGGTSGWTVDGGTWGVVSGNLQQTSTAADCRDVYYAPSWTDYTLTLRARKISGDEGFLIMFRVKDHNNFYWWNIGGWGNARTTVERCVSGGKADACSSTSDIVTTGVWYNIKIVAQGSHIQCYLKLESESNYRLIHDFTDNATYPGFDAVTTHEDATGDILVKIVNRTSNILTNTPISITSTGWPKAKATVTTLASASDADENTIANPTKVSPVSSQLTGLSLPFNYTLQPYSLTIFRLSRDTYTITASAGANGTVTPAGTTTKDYGTSQAYTITPNTGYAIASVLVDGVNNPSAVSSGTYTFSNITANHTISAAFILTTKTITASTGANGSVTPNGAVSVNYGSNQAFTFAPSAGYGILDVKVDGDSIVPVTSYTFNNVTANHTISATFAKLKGINNKAALTDSKLIGKVVKVWGKVKTVNGTTSFTISDGYNNAGITVNVNGAALPSGFGIGKTAAVTGILGADKAVKAQDIKTP
ncbi:MAG: carbohydrate binding domain-containing protein [Armatimonadetes bacterium]|nr:carbohydrate binding domain-containing protein [Armatimonadota bacterium]